MGVHRVHDQETFHVEKCSFMLLPHIFNSFKHDFFTNLSILSRWHTWQHQMKNITFGEKVLFENYQLPTSVFELDFLEAYHIHKNHNNVVNNDFTIPHL